MARTSFENALLLAAAHEAQRSGKAVQLRRQAGLKRADVKAITGASRPTVGRWEQGQRMASGSVGLAYAELLLRLGLMVPGLDT
jgi:DNA-binding transcriptional regulator YiaG